MTSPSLIDRVGALLDEVIAGEVMPRFRRLVAGEVESKGSAADDDLVTVVDRLVERRLETGLPPLLPGSLVVGEEAVHADPRRLEALAGDDPVWLIDPIDGTRRFAAGDDGFGVMVALVERGAARAAWIRHPARGTRLVAEAGAGAFRDGERLRVPTAAPRLRGALNTRYMPPALAAAIAGDTGERYQLLPPTSAAALEYPNVAAGERDFVVYHRLLPWDHAPGALLLSEAGGRVVHLDGTLYTPRSPSQPTVAAVSAEAAAEVRAWLLGLARRAG